MSQKFRVLAAAMPGLVALVLSAQLQAGVIILENNNDSPWTLKVPNKEQVNFAITLGGAKVTASKIGDKEDYYPIGKGKYLVYVDNTHVGTRDWTIWLGGSNQVYRRFVVTNETGNPMTDGSGKGSIAVYHLDYKSKPDDTMVAIAGKPDDDGVVNLKAKSPKPEIIILKDNYPIQPKTRPRGDAVVSP
jgi:hypothetical protein